MFVRAAHKRNDVALLTVPCLHEKRAEIFSHLCFRHADAIIYEGDFRNVVLREIVGIADYLDPTREMFLDGGHRVGVSVDHDDVRLTESVDRFDAIFQQLTILFVKGPTSRPNSRSDKKPRHLTTSVW